jgi:putative DNA primase/helicase
MSGASFDREPPVDPIEAALADLKVASDAEAAEGPLVRLAEAVRYTRDSRRAVARERAIAVLNGKVSAPAKLVDAFFATEQHVSKREQARPISFSDPEPWPDTVDGAALLEAIANALSRHVALPPHAADTIALWVVFAHALDAADIAPILALISPERRCGKTTTFSLLAKLVPRPVPSSNTSSAAIYRVIEKHSPTLLIDEADSFLAAREELRGILNSGHTRDAAYVLRADGDDHEPRQFSTWSAKAVALIGHLPDTLADRSIIVRMRRRAPQEHLERLRHDRLGAFVELKRQAARWAADHLCELRAGDPEVPKALSNDRAADNWRALLVIADLAGGEWPERARRAALALSGEAIGGEESIRELLLADIRDTFGDREEMFTDDLLGRLCGREERPWCEWKAGHPLSAVQLARLLKPFSVRPGQLRDGPRTAKGYKLRDLADAFSRYLSPSEPSQPSQSNAGAGLADSPTRHSTGSVTAHDSGPNPYRASVVTGVTTQAPSRAVGVPAGSPLAAAASATETGEWSF